MLAVFVLAYTLGIFVRLVWLLITGLTPKAHGLQRPLNADEYFLAPLVWPVDLVWWLKAKLNKVC